MAAAAAAAAAAGGGEADGLEPIATLLQHPGDPLPTPARGPAFVLQPTMMPGGALPLLVTTATPADAPGSRTRRAAARQRQTYEQPCDCQVILYDRRTPLPLSSSSSSGGHSSSGAKPAGGSRTPRSAAGRRRLAASLASHLLGALLACLLLAHSQHLAAGLAAGYAALAGFAARQLAWLMTAQPAGALLLAWDVGVRHVTTVPVPGCWRCNHGHGVLNAAAAVRRAPRHAPQASSCTASSASCWRWAACSMWRRRRRRCRAGAPPWRAAR